LLLKDIAPRPESRPTALEHREEYSRGDILATCLYCFHRGKNGGMMIDGTGKKILDIWAGPDD
jgi:hypothetical protein